MPITSVMAESVNAFLDLLVPPSTLSGAKKAPRSSTASGTLDSGDIEMHATSEPSATNADDEDEALRKLAYDLNIITPETPYLSAEDRHDLALFEMLTKAQAHQSRAMGVESEIIESGKWNFDATVQLIELTNQMSRIPFPTKPELYNLKPTSADKPATPTKSAQAKGKQRADRAPHRRSLYHMFPKESRAWCGPVGNV